MAKKLAYLHLHCNRGCIGFVSGLRKSDVVGLHSWRFCFEGCVRRWLKLDKFALLKFPKPLNPIPQIKVRGAELSRQSGDQLGRKWHHFVPLHLRVFCG